MKAEDITSKPREAKYLSTTMVVAAVVAFATSAYVAWPALVHLGQKIF